eukprot:XP_008675763.1 plasma membrane ATPase-like [Zea mays]
MVDSRRSARARDDSARLDATTQEVHFLPFNFNPVDKCMALTAYIDDDRCHRVSNKSAPKQIMTLRKCQEDVTNKVDATIDKHAERGLAVARQEVSEKRSKDDDTGYPWQFVALPLLPLLDSPPMEDNDGSA